MTNQRFSVDEIRRHTAVEVDGAWNARIVATVERRVRRRRRMGRASVGVLGALLLLGGAAWWQRAPRQGGSVSLRLHDTPAPAPAPTSGGARTVRFDDGATGQLASAGSRVVVTEHSPTHTTVAIGAGAVTFEVAHTGRTFRVDAGPVRVVVVGTAFVVDRRDDGVAVSVQRGRVRVEDGGETLAVSAGETHWFPTAPTPTTAPAPAPTPTTAPPAETARPRSTLAASKHATPRWRMWAQRGDFHRAYKLLARPGGKPRDDVEELLLAADVARRSNHFAEAMPYYDSVLLSHADDPRASLAALTKGRIALHRLGHPREAAAAFARARALSLPEALIEDALFGEVTAWHRAGETAKARDAAAEYVRRYPHSPAVENVRRLADLR